MKKLSDDLMQKELWLMRLVYESENCDIIPEVVKDIKLTDTELSMSAQEQYNLARDYMFYGEYNALKLEIDNSIFDFNQELNKIIEENIVVTNRTIHNSLLYKYTLFTLFIIWCIVILLVLNKHIMKPILAYIKIYSDFDRESQDASFVIPKGMKEVYLLGLAYNKATMKMNQLKDSIEGKNIELEIQKNTDPLTGIYNRGFFDTQEWKTIENTNYTIFCVDVNRFKEINDTYGHGIGDKVLQFIVEILKNTIRNTDVIIRMGGDEFLLLIEESAKNEGVAFVENRLEALQGTQFCTADIRIPVYFSYGRATHIKGNNSFDEVFHLADVQMYINKKNQKHFH